MARLRERPMHRTSVETLFVCNGFEGKLIRIDRDANQSAFEWNKVREE
jgi:hypothetical protein